MRQYIPEEISAKTSKNRASKAIKKVKFVKKSDVISKKKHERMDEEEEQKKNLEQEIEEAFALVFKNSPLNNQEKKDFIDIMKFFVWKAAKVSNTTQFDALAINMINMLYEKFGDEVIALLHAAIREKTLDFGYIELIVKRFEEIGISLNIPDKKGMTVLDALCSLLPRSQDEYELSLHDKIFKYLHDKGAKLSNNLIKNIDIQDPIDGMTMLCRASCFGWISIAKELIEHNADVNICDNENKSPLHWACRSRYQDIAKMLLDAKADVKIESKETKETALHWASCAPEFEEIVDRLIHEGAKVNSTEREGRTPLHCAALHGRSENIEILIEEGASRDVKDNKGKTPLDYAINNTNEGHIKCVALLIRSIDLVYQNEAYKKAFIEAASVGKIVLVKLLTKRIAIKDQNKVYNEALKKAASAYKICVVESLVESLVDELGNDFIDNKYEVAELLTKAKASANIPNEEGKTAVELDEENRCVKIIKFLLSKDNKPTEHRKILTILGEKKYQLDKTSQIDPEQQIKKDNMGAEIENKAGDFMES
jgi:ankyrin repeat protein